MFRAKIRGTTQSDYDMNEYTKTEIKLYIFQLLSLADSCCRSPSTVRAPLGDRDRNGDIIVRTALNIQTAVHTRSNMIVHI